MLGVVIPAFNEAGRIGSSVSAIFSKFPDALVLVADDGSSDRTAKEAGAAGAAVVSFRENRGKGAAVREGVLEALRLGCSAVLFTDRDLACPPEEWGRVLLPLEEGAADVSIASRWLPESRVEGRPLVRGLASWGFALLARFLTGLPYRDFQCGCKAFGREAARALFSEPFRCERYAFDVEVLLRARDLGLRVAEVPVLWRAGKGSKVKLLKHGLEMLRSLLALRAAYGREASDACVDLRPGSGTPRLRRADAP